MYTAGANTPISHTPTLHLFAFPKELVKAIIIGARATAELRDNLRGITRSDSGYGHVRVQQATVNPDHYRLDFVDLSADV
jgi:hypothetical protein